MQGYLNKNQIEYIFYHLKFFIDTKNIENNIHFHKSEQIKTNKSQIVFNLSDKKIDETEIFSINDIPILFPLNKEKQFYYFEKNNLIFTHDILKSAFYLLSAYQEIECKERDNLNRFQYKKSIQKKLSFIKKPIVNYYFEIISDAFLEFGNRNGIEIKLKNPFEKPLFVLSHDVDRIKTTYFSKIPFKIKQLFGLKPSRLNKKRLLTTIINYFFRFYKNFWSFDWLINLEEKNNVRSAFFFLDNNSAKDSIYFLNDKKIISVVKKLINKKFEVGIHGTFNSYKNEEELTRIRIKLQDVSKITTIGIRQHYLKYEIPNTQKLQQKAGYLYDTSVGFAEHEGFRNSYCFPFKLYDFENDKMLNIWEIPLVAMDGTLFEYRGLNFQQAKKTINEISEEVKKFNGVFTLLWHNDYFDEVELKGITAFYENLLTNFSTSGFKNILGKNLIKIIN